MGVQLILTTEVRALIYGYAITKVQSIEVQGTLEILGLR